LALQGLFYFMNPFFMNPFSAPSAGIHGQAIHPVAGHLKKSGVKEIV
jgi:hypothetical protein